MKYRTKAGIAVAAVFLFMTQGFCGIFQNDTLNAYDGQYWNSSFSREDSTILSNESDRTMTIDSILIEFDDPAYSARCQFGWEERKLNDFPVRKYHYTSSGLYVDTADRRSVLLSVYNSGGGSKLTIPPRSTVTMYPIFFSETFSAAGIIVECFSGMCHDYVAKNVIRNFSGRLIFVIDGERDTLQLTCEHIRWTSGILPHTATLLQKNVPSAHVQAYSLLGQKGNLAARAALMQCVRGASRVKLQNGINNKR